MLRNRHYKILNEIKIMGNNLELERVIINLRQELERRNNIYATLRKTKISMSISPKQINFINSKRFDGGCL